VTSFEDYAAVAEAYDDRAFPTARVTAAIRLRADEIVGAAATPREQARLLYEWVARNIRYATNLMGIGSVVPRDAGDVLSTRFGDCKDHVTLYPALLASRGIDSSPALIDATASYTLTDLPVFGRFNHVISWVPSLGLFVDPSADLVPFGQLPINDAGKQVVTTAHFEGLRRTPPVPEAAVRSRSKKVVRLLADGTVEGRIENEESAYIASGVRASFETLKPEQEKQLVSSLLSGYAGTGTITHADPRGAGDTYTYAMDYRISNGWNVPGPGALNILTLLASTLPVSRLGAAAASPARTHPYLCLGGTSIEDYTYEFPESVKITALPKDVHLQLPFLNYSATYRQSGHTVTVNRVAEEPFDSHLCTPEDLERSRAVSADITRDLHAQILYQ
jgi:hypothetical protein